MNQMLRGRIAIPALLACASHVNRRWLVAAAVSASLWAGSVAAQARSDVAQRAAALPERRQRIGEARPDGHEVSEVRRFGLDALPDDLAFPHDRQVLSDWKRAVRTGSLIGTHDS